MKSAGKARNNGLYRHIRTSKEIIRNLLNDSTKRNTQNSAHPPCCLTFSVWQLIIKSEAIKDISVSVVVLSEII